MIDFKEAIRILHPETTAVALKEYEYYGGFHGNKAAIEAINEASILACEAMEKQVPKKPTMMINECDSFKIGNITFGRGTMIYKCRCGNFVTRSNNYCTKCGQAIDWEG